jgi:excinuclease ABC subunit C
LRYPVENSNIDYLKSVIFSLPSNPGIYQFFDVNNTIIYVGKAKNLKNRVSSYFIKNHDQRKTAILVKNIFDIKYLIVETEEDALLLENSLIKKYRPRFNIRLKDDKSYPWISIKNEQFPRVFKTRELVDDGSEYFGPYTSQLVISTFLDLFKSTYKLRNCNFILSEENIRLGKIHLCLEYYIGNCSGPCEFLISKENYLKGIDEIRTILKGNITSVIKALKNEMIGHSSLYNFEEANLIKLKIEKLEKYQKCSTVVNPRIKDVDVFSLIEDENFFYINFLKVLNGSIIQTYTSEYKKLIEENREDILITHIIELRQKVNSFSTEILVPFKFLTHLPNIKFVVPRKGDKKHLLDLSIKNVTSYRTDKIKQLEYSNPKQKLGKLLEAIKRDLHLRELPQRIECFDNSNFQGTSPVSSCVVFINTLPAKREYRHFNVKTVKGPNDFASMEEVVYRRYKRQIEEEKPLPQLVIIDGGLGQLKSAVIAIEKLGLKGKITLIGIAKRLEEIYFPNDNIPIYIDKNSETLMLIQRIRDEAHRFGIKFHRQKRSKNFIGSELQQIKGIGPQTIKNVLLKFKSVERIKNLTIEELALEIGMPKAQLIKKYFNAPN